MAHIMTYKNHKPEIDSSVFVAETATIVGNVKIGEMSSIWYNTVLRGDFNHITVGKYTNIQDNTTVHVEPDQELVIGDYVLIGHNSIIHGSKIGDGCLIGMGAILQGYSEIGENCIIGAGTMINQNKKIPPNSMVYGNPARIVRTLSAEEIQGVRKHVLEYAENGQIHKKNQQVL
jgi:carbonic anhydrase/acetyltransferase-like protein (isoleucine patch superfamily)